MDIIKGLFPLLFAAINFFLLINLLFFGRKIKNVFPVLLLVGALFLSQLCEFLYCFFELDYQLVLLLTITGIWLAPIFVIIFVLSITGMEKLTRGFYILAVLIFITLILNYGEISGACSLLAMSVLYPSHWLMNYMSYAFLIIAAVKLNFGFKNVSDAIEIKKRRILLYSIILTLITSLILMLTTGEEYSFAESILAKTHLFISVGMAFFVIRDKYKTEGNL